MSCPRSRSRSGYSRTSAWSSATSSSSRPRARSASIRASSAAIRASSRRVSSCCAKSSYLQSASAGPRHSASGASLGLGQVLRDPVEEGRPPFLGPLVLLGGHASALLEEHLGPAVAEIGEDDDHQLVGVLPRLVGERKHEPLGLDHLAILALPVDLAALGAGEHRRPPRAPGPDVHRDRGDGHLGLAASEPVGEAFGLGPLLPHAITRRVEDASGPDPLGRWLSHSRIPSRSLAGARRGGRSFPARTDGTSRASRQPPSAAPLSGARAEAAPSGPA